MKITFSNLGAIKKTTLDLRPLTVIIGPNNSNKTYIAYSIYGLWKNLYGFEEGAIDPIPLIPLKIYIKDLSTYTIKADKSFYVTIIKYFKQKANTYFKDLDTYFQDSTAKLFSRTRFEIEVSEKEINNVLNYLVADEELEDSYDFKVTLENSVITIHVKEGSEVYEADILEVFTFFMRLHMFRLPILMPAERNAFIITYKMLANRRYRHLRQMQREFIGRRSEQRQLELLKEQGDIRYPQPIEDFLDFLTDVELEKSIIDNSKTRPEFYELADKIEEYIQGKNKTLFKPTRLGGKEIKINIKESLDIDLYNASSSIKQLAPLLLYLRHEAGYNDLLIIDEPEMNLHPESQVKLLEVLAMLVNEGVNVLLTTHSPYFMSHLNNLISGDMNNEKVRESQAKSLYLTDERAFLSPEDVSAYEMKNNKLVSLKHKDEDGDYSISWETLSDVSADIQQKFFEMYEKRETTSSGEEKE